MGETQEEGKEVSSKWRWSWDGAVRCKKCSRLHYFREYGSEAEIDYFFKFSEANPPAVRIPCLYDIDVYEEYQYAEILMPPSVTSERKLQTLEARIARVERIVGGADLGKDEKTVWQRLTTLEKLSSEVVKEVLGTKSKESPKDAPKPKEPPRGQVA